jgi:hypothetical protein
MEIKKSFPAHLEANFNTNFNFDRNPHENSSLVHIITAITVQ